MHEVGGALVLVGCLLSACATQPQRRGPLPVRNQHPAQLTVLHQDSRPADTLPAGIVTGRATAAYSSLFLSGANTTNAFLMDGEILRASLQTRIGLGGGFELAAELPVVYTTGGFLDDFLIDYHDLFGLPDQGRADAPRDQFNVFADYQGLRVFELRDDTLEFADVPLSLAFCPLPSSPGVPGLAVRAAVELPTGDEDIGIGNGELDVGFGADATLPLADVTIHVGVQHTFAGSPRAARDARFDFADVTAAEAGVEIHLQDGLAAIAQLQWETSTLRYLGFERVADDQVLLWIGARLRLDGDWFVEASLGEDLQAFVSPDVTFWLSMAWLPGGRGE